VEPSTAQKAPLVCYSTRPNARPAKAIPTPPPAWNANLGLAAPLDCVGDVVPVGVPLPPPLVLPLTELVGVAAVPIAFALNASKVLALFSFALIEPTMPLGQCPVCAQKNQKGVDCVIWMVHVGKADAFAGTGMKPEVRFCCEGSDIEVLTN